MKRLIFIIISVSFISLVSMQNLTLASVVNKKQAKKPKLVSQTKLKTAVSKAKLAVINRATKAVEKLEVLTNKYIHNLKSNDKDLQAVQGAAAAALEALSKLDQASKEYKVLMARTNSANTKLFKAIDEKEELAIKAAADAASAAKEKAQTDSVVEAEKAVTAAECVELKTEDDIQTVLNLGKTAYDMILTIKDPTKAAEYNKRLLALGDKIETFQKSNASRDGKVIIADNASNKFIPSNKGDNGPSQNDIVNWDVRYNQFTQEIEAEITTKNNIASNHNFYLVVYDGDTPLYGGNGNESVYDEYTKIDWFGNSGLYANRYFTGWYAFSNDTRKKLYLQPGRTYRIGIRENGYEGELAGEFVNIKLPDNINDDDNIISPTYYSMADPKWASHPYYPVKLNIPQNGRVISRNGCGPTSMSMVIATLSDPSVTPATITDYSMEHGYINSDYDTTFDLFMGADNAAKAYGLDVVTTSDVNKLRNLLVDGKHVAIASMGPGHFTSGGHLITLMGITKVNGTDRFIVYDPNTYNGSYDKDSYYNDGQVIQTKNKGIVLATMDVINSEKFSVPDDVFFIFSKKSNNSGQTNSTNIGVSQKLIQFIANYETYQKYKYQDKYTGKWKIGFGHVILPGENYDSGISYEDAMNLLKNEVSSKYSNSIRQWSKDYNYKLSQSQFDALVDFAYSSGEDALKGSILEKNILNVTASDDIRNAFCMWAKVDCNGVLVECADLWRRMMDEADIYNKGDYIIDYPSAPSGYH